MADESSLMPPPPVEPAPEQQFAHDTQVAGAAQSLGRWSKSLSESLTLKPLMNQRHAPGWAIQLGFFLPKTKLCLTTQRLHVDLWGGSTLILCWSTMPPPARTHCHGFDRGLHSQFSSKSTIRNSPIDDCVNAELRLLTCRHALSYKP